MFTAIYYSFLIAFILPTFAQELRVNSANPEINYSDEQWLLIRDAIFSYDTQGLLDWDSKLDYLFPEIKSFEKQSPIFDALARTPNASKKPSRDTYRMCPLCGKLVSKISVHLRYHKDEYRYPCDQCPQMFKEACNLSKHLQRHEKKRALEDQNLPNPFAKRISTSKNPAAQATQEKHTRSKTTNEEDPEAYRNPELQGSEYIPTESAQPVLGKLSLRGKEVSDASDPRLARSLERMAQNPEQATVLPHHLRLEFKVKKITPTKPALPNDPTKAQSSDRKKHANYPVSDLSNLKKFRCANCSMAYKREGFLEKHMALCIAQLKKFPSATPLPAVPCEPFNQSLSQQPAAGAKHPLDNVQEADTQAKKCKKNDQKFECTLCEKKYGRIGHLNKHLLSHYRGPKKPSVAHLEGIACTLCSKTFTYDRDYQNHMNAHTGQKPHVCTRCNKGFATRSNLTDHMRHYCGQ